jgi:hypothetical protein
MDMLPKTDRTLVVRTDFSDQDTWQAVRSAVDHPPGGDLVFSAFDHVDDPGYAGQTPQRIIDLLPDDPFHAIIVLADEVTMSSPETPLLVVDLVGDPGHTFRSIPQVLWNVANNLFVANCSFDEFVERVDDDGIYRCGGRDGQIKLLTAIAELKGVPFDKITFDVPG